MSPSTFALSSLPTKLRAVFGTVLTLLAIFGVAALSYGMSAQQAQNVSQTISAAGEALAQSAAAESVDLFLNEDFSGLEPLLTRYSDYPSVVYVRAFALDGTLLDQSQLGGASTTNLPGPLTLEPFSTIQNGRLSLWQPIQHDTELLGVLNLELSLAPSQQLQAWIFWMMFLSVSTALIGIISFTTSLRRRIIDIAAQHTDDEQTSKVRDAEARKHAWVANRTRNAVVITDAEGYTEWVNEAFTRLTGYALDEVKGKKPGDLLQGPETDPDTVAYIRRQLALGEGFQVEMLNYTNSGQPYWIDIEVQPIHDASGQLVNFVAIESDVTERKETLEALQASERLFRAVVESLGEGLFITGPDDVVSYANPRVEAITGYAPDEFVGRRAYEILLPEEAHAAAAERNLRRFKGVSERYEVRCFHKDGRTIWLDNHATPLLDADGHVIGTLGAFTDVTDRIEATAALEQQRDFAMTVMNTIGQGLTVVDADWSFAYVNPAFARITGYTPEDLIGKTPLDLTPEADKGVLEDVKMTRLKNEVTSYETRLLHADGEARDVLITGVPRFQEGQFTGTISVVTDITERKLTEEELTRAKDAAEAANHAKSEFLSRMSHELRTPLNAILGFAQLLELDDLQDDQNESVDRILKAGRHLLDLINEVLDISRIEAGTLSLSLEGVRLHEVVYDSARLIQPLADKSGVRISLDVPQDVEVIADLQRLKQVLLNLLSNAVKYNQSGGQVYVEGHSDTAAFNLEVRDTGLGIPAHYLARLFTPFDRLGAEQTEVEGSGIGLALTKRLVDAMDGAITVESKPGKGSSFFVSLPLATSTSAAAPKRAASHSEADPAADRRLKVVYVEDNLLNVALVEKILARVSNVELLTAMQGQLGLELIREQRPDLVLLDLHLPGLSGNEVLDQLRKDLVTKEIPVVILSADATPKQIDTILAKGVRAYLTKPINVQELLEVISSEFSSAEVGSV